MSESKLNPFARGHKPEQQGALDARRRPLQIDDEVILDTGHPIYFRVIGIKPAMDPRLPPNQILVEVAAALHFLCTNGQPNPEFIRVRTAEEAGPSNLVKIDNAPDDPPEAPPTLVTP